MKRTGTATFFAIGILVVWGCDTDKGDFDDSEDLNREVISCEIAIERLANCCPGFDADRDGQCIDRAYQDTNNGCDTKSKKTGHTLPEMTMAESECVRETSCADLVKRGICSIVQKNGPRGVWTSEYSFTLDHIHESGGGTFEHQPVCVRVAQ